LKLRTLGVALGGLAATLLAACGGGGDDRVLSFVFEAAPWSNEQLDYQLLNERDEIYGTCEYQTEVDFEPGKTRLTLLCGDGPYRDDRTAIVASDTLIPFTATRVNSDSEKNKRISFTTTYEPPIVRFQSDENGKIRDAERDLPEPDDNSPEPGYYDDESLLWLVRGIPLRVGWEGSFQNVNAGTGQTFPVDLKVEAQERVTVAAGEFTAWRVRIRTDSVTQVAWIDAESPHRLVKARMKGVQDVTYELTAIR